MNGPDATRTLREHGFTLPIIGVTGNVLPADKEHFLAAGANQVLPKPLNLASLLSAYSDVVMSGEVEREDEIGGGWRSSVVKDEEGQR